jgi:threonine aldolase
VGHHAPPVAFIRVAALGLDRTAPDSSSSGLVDLRSDTVTKPTPVMRRAMLNAEVGDDGYGEDPTVRALEEAFAERVAKDAAVYVPSGTMANQIALRLLGRPGTRVVAGRRQHVVVYEAGAAGLNSSTQFHLVADADGLVHADQVLMALAEAEHHQPPVSSVFVENTHMPAGGVPWPLDTLVELGSLGVPVHLDGARLFNAEVATEVKAADYAAPAATVMCCLSKGLAAPVGSVLAGSRELMAAARVERKRLGGAMRQAGVIAAAGLVALNDMVGRLADDHRRARRLADAVAETWPQSGLDPETVQTNVVVFRHANPPALLEHLRGDGILAGSISPGVVRLMTHLDVDDAGIERAVLSLATAP